MAKIKLLCPEVKNGGDVKQKAYTKEFQQEVAEKILRKGRWSLPYDSAFVFKDGSIVPKAVKPKEKPKETKGT